MGIKVVTTYLITGMLKRKLIQGEATTVEELAKGLKELDDAGVMFASVWFIREVRVKVGRGQGDGG